MSDCGKKNYRTRYHCASQKRFTPSRRPREPPPAQRRDIATPRRSTPTMRSWKKPEAFRQTPAAASTVGMWYIINNNTGHVMRCACDAPTRHTHRSTVLRNIVIIFVVVDVITRWLWSVIKMNSLTFDAKKN